MSRRLASGLLAAALAGALPAAFAVPAQADPLQAAPGSDDVFVDVAVSTAWTDPGIAREIDAPSLGNPVDMRAWTTSMTTEEKRWLTGNLETAALYGTEVDVVDRQGEWSEIRVPEQHTPRSAAGYPGWVPTAQLVESPAFDRRQDGDQAVVTEPTTWLYRGAALRHKSIEVIFNTELPVLGRTNGAVRVATPSDGAQWVDADAVDVRAPGEKPPEPSGSDLVATGKRFLGLPYLWAGVSGFGFDCSGFTYAVHRAHGIDIPRDSTVQATRGTPVEREDLRPGDLLFFAYDQGEGRVHHVGMYIGGGRMIHSPNASRAVEIVDVVDSGYGVEYHSARRYWGD